MNKPIDNRDIQPKNPFVVFWDEPEEFESIPHDGWYIFDSRNGKTVEGPFMSRDEADKRVEELKKVDRLE